MPAEGCRDKPPVPLKGGLRSNMLFYCSSLINMSNDCVPAICYYQHLLRRTLHFLFTIEQKNSAIMKHHFVNFKSKFPFRGEGMIIDTLKTHQNTFRPILCLQKHLNIFSKLILPMQRMVKQILQKA